MNRLSGIDTRNTQHRQRLGVFSFTPFLFHFLYIYGMGSYLNPCGNQQYKVYNRTVDGGIQTVIYAGANLIAFGAPSQFKGSYIDGGDNFPENDRVTLKADGFGFADKYPHQVYMQDGTQVGDLDAVKAYFDELGIGVQSGGGSFDPTQYYTKAEIDQIVADIYAAIGTTPLDTPVGAFSNTTSNSTTLTLTTVANASTYEFKRNGVVVQSGASNVLNDAGLSASTQYNYTWVAKGAGYANSLPGSGSVTTQAGGGGDTSIYQLSSDTLLDNTTQLYAA